jgi:DNA-binding NarL/FixJ family response regulator
MSMSELSELTILGLHAAQPPAFYVVLTAREHMLLRLLAEGLTNVQVGRTLHRSEKTVRNQLTHLYRKLGAANRAEAVALYLTRHQEDAP